MTTEHPDLRRRPVRDISTRGSPRATLLDAQLSSAELRRARGHGQLRRLAHGLYTFPDHLLEEDSAALETLHALTSGSDRLVSHATAAVLQDMRTGRLDAPFHLTSPRTGSRVRRPGLVVGHRTNVPEEFTAETLGLPATHPAWTFVDLCPQLSGLLDAVTLADQMLRAPRPEFGERGSRLTSPEQLEAAVAARTASPGVRLARNAAHLARERVDSPRETELRLAILRAGLPEPSVNIRVRDEQGRTLFQPDLAFEDLRVAVQYDGHHHSDPQQVERDVARAEIATAHGWIEVRLTNRHRAAGWQAAIRKIVDALCAHGWRPDGRIRRR
ncbi:hypothetical protein GCM10027060_14760 [Nesterenkonia halophila]